jgi:hypothetical protein
MSEGDPHHEPRVIPICCLDPLEAEREATMLWAEGGWKVNCIFCSCT